MDKVLKDLIFMLNHRQPQMIKQLHQFCEINSGTFNLHGLAQMQQTLTAAFAAFSDETYSYPLPSLLTVDMQGETITQQCGNALFIRKRPQLTRRVLLCGHMDTVYAADHCFQQLTYVDNHTINGPGVADMKGGLIVMLEALHAFERTEIASTLGWDVLINSDEEIGSPVSRCLIEEKAKNYQAALVYEPAMDSEGTLAKNRKGSGKLTLIAHGKAAHAGRDFFAGRNAICYLAEIITAIHALNGKRAGVTINVGKIAGGEALNVVPDKAVAKLDIRISLPDDEKWVREQMDIILQRLSSPDYSINIEGQFGRPIKQVNHETKQLFKRIQQLGLDLGLSIRWQDSGGCCDGNNLAQFGLPVIDTLGVRGGNIHSLNEFILLDSLPERAALSLLILHDLAAGGLEELKQ